jgi:anthranilate phosphoribosyltransferase
LIGVFAPELTDRLAAVLRELGSKRAWVVHADDGLDELSTLGPTRVTELADGHLRTWTLDPASLGLPYARLSDLQIASVDQAAAAMLSVLRGEKGPLQDVAVLNAAAALAIAEKVSELADGISLARQALESGAAMQTFQSLISIASP